MLDTVLDTVLADLRCPVCRTSLRRDGRRLVCDHGHTFDVARQGYVSLTAGDVGHGTADTPAMVAARESFLGAGHYDRIGATMHEALADVAPGLVVDLAGGTGHHLGVVLDALPLHRGLCLDLSAPALRRAARAHPRAAAVGADVWRELPLRDACATAMLSVFGPRNPAEIARVLAPAGVLVVVTPTPAHLGELVAPLGMVRVDPDKAARVANALTGYVERSARTLHTTLSLSRAEAVALAAMGPTGQHATTEELTARAAKLREPVDVTVSVRVAGYRRG